MADLGAGITVADESVLLSGRTGGYLYADAALALSGRLSAQMVDSGWVVALGANPVSYVCYSDGVDWRIEAMPMGAILDATPAVQCGVGIGGALYDDAELALSGRLSAQFVDSADAIVLGVNPVSYMLYALGAGGGEIVTVYFHAGWDAGAQCLVYWDSTGAPNLMPDATRPALVGSLIGARVVGLVAI